MARFTRLALSLTCALLYVGLALLLGARLREAVLFLAVARRAEGVVESVRVAAGEDGPLGYLTVSYAPAGGDALRAEARTPFSGRWPAVGERVEVLYRPDRERTIEVGPRSRLWPGPLLGLAVMAPVALLCVWWVLAEVRQLLPRRRRARAP